MSDLDINSLQQYQKQTLLKEKRQSLWKLKEIEQDLLRRNEGYLAFIVRQKINEAKKEYQELKGS
jgi:hypothetical protein